MINADVLHYCDEVNRLRRLIAEETYPYKVPKVRVAQEHRMIFRLAFDALTTAEALLRQASQE